MLADGAFRSPYRAPMECRYRAVQAVQAEPPFFMPLLRALCGVGLRLGPGPGTTLGLPDLDSGGDPGMADGVPEHRDARRTPGGETMAACAGWHGARGECNPTQSTGGGVMAGESVLQSDAGGAVVRIGDTVHRPTGWWTPSVHALLSHLESAGFTYSPRVLGTDEHGREILTHIEGDAGKDAWAHVVPEAGLRRFAQLLRAYHDAVEGFRPAPDAVWLCTERSLRAGELVCHGDFGPWNVVWRDGKPVGLLDWDCAGPGRRVDDIAYALEYAAPFRDDETCVQWLRYPSPPDRKRRMAVFADAYGWPSTDGLVDEVLRVQRAGVEAVRLLAARGLQPQADWVAAGHLDELAARVAWTEANRGLWA